MILGVGGPKGAAAAARRYLAGGSFVSGMPPGPVPARSMCVQLAFGTVLDDGEDPGSERALAAAGHGAGVALHAMWERGADFSRFPGGPEWLAEIEALPASERHLAVHDRHLIALTERDAKVVNGPMLRQFGLARTKDEWREHLVRLEEAGITEIAYQPAGPDIPGELQRFAEAAGI